MAIRRVSIILEDRISTPLHSTSPHNDPILTCLGISPPVPKNRKNILLTPFTNQEEAPNS